MLSKDAILSVVVPIYNQEASLGFFLETLLEILPRLADNYELILVDDGSKDGTVSVASAAAGSNMNIRLVVLSRHYGLEIAMTAGLEQSIGDYVLLLDSQIRDFLELIPQLLEKIVKENLDLVYAARTSRKGEPWLRKYFANLFYRVAAHLTGFDMPNNASDYRVMNRRAVNAITALKEHNRYLSILYAYVGYRVGSVPFEFPPYFRGYSQYGWLQSIGTALNAILSFSTLPLRYMSFMSVSISLMLMLFNGYVLIAKFLLKDSVAEGWTSLMFVMSLLFSVLFLFLSLLSEYIGRILTETKQRPLYYIREEIGGTAFKIRNIVNRV